MKDYKYSYTICNEFDSEIFSRQCQAIEKNIPNIRTVKKLQDVDGTETAEYIVDGKTLIVKNDYMVDAVYIDSDIDIDQFF